MNGTRIQIIAGGRLAAEAIVENSREADDLWSKWTNLRYKRNLPMGCAVYNRSDLPRNWNVPVGSEVAEKTDQDFLRHF